MATSMLFAYSPITAFARQPMAFSVNPNLNGKAWKNATPEVLVFPLRTEQREVAKLFNKEDLNLQPSAR